MSRGCDSTEAENEDANSSGSDPEWTPPPTTREIAFFAIKDVVKENIKYVPMPDECNKRIVGGFEISIERTPYQIALKKYTFFKWETFCGGSLVTMTYVLTAAHCVMSDSDTLRSSSDVRVVAATTRAVSTLFTYGSEHWRRLRRVWVHDGYSSYSFVNDIAVIQVDGAFIRSRSIRPVRLHTKDTNFEAAPGTVCVVSGYGYRENVNFVPQIFDF
ncbi:Trypsin epsilon [Eumeta japonica]|uniref:Trypsin epsilon n=1 Tax=Eumeta variegata TaxID=151549 RepID=A0A4C1V1Q4_EUMVA|nr:Trypsin epsilon [Eumeta japonica]